MVSHLVGFYYFILSAFRDPEPPRVRISCTGFDEGKPLDVVCIDHEWEPMTWDGISWKTCKNCGECK